MTFNEAKEIFINRGYIEVDGGTVYDPDKWREACYDISVWLTQEYCSDTISRQAVLDTLDNMDKALNEDRTVENYKELLKECYEVLTPAIPQPNTAYLFLLDKCANGGYYCSKCHKKVVKEGWSGTVKKIKFCPNCGRKILGVK